MSFLKSTDYSGGRTYDGAPAARAVIDHFRLRIALNFAWARLKIARFMRFIAAPTSPSAPTARGFTMLWRQAAGASAAPPDHGHISDSQFGRSPSQDAERQPVLSVTGAPVAARAGSTP